MAPRFVVCTCNAKALLGRPTSQQWHPAEISSPQKWWALSARASGLSRRRPDGACLLLVGDEDAHRAVGESESAGAGRGRAVEVGIDVVGRGGGRVEQEPPAGALGYGGQDKLAGLRRGIDEDQHVAG